MSIHSNKGNAWPGANEASESCRHVAAGRARVSAHTTVVAAGKMLRMLPTVAVIVRAWDKGSAGCVPMVETRRCAWCDLATSRASGHVRNAHAQTSGLGRAGRRISETITA